MFFSFNKLRIYEGKINRILFLTLCFCLVSSLCFATEKYNFRKTTWGMTKKEVKQVEGEPQYEVEDKLLYLDTVAGMNCVVIYTFENGKLVRGGYKFLVKHSNKNLYIDDYEIIKELLIKKYGKPKSDSKIWKGGEYYKNEPDEWGFAISAGYLHSLQDGKQKTHLSCFL